MVKLRFLFQFQAFLTQINSSLVDSNMLVRCIVLSLDRFESQTEDVKGKSGLMAGELLKSASDKIWWKSDEKLVSDQILYLFIYAR